MRTFPIHPAPFPLPLRFDQGLIFVVDSNDRERIGEAKEELTKMVRWPCRLLAFVCGRCHFPADA